MILGRRGALAAGAAAVALLATWRVAPRAYNARRLRSLAGRRVYDEGADATALVQAALARGSREHKRALAILGGNWCQWCLALDDLMTTDDEIRALVAERLVVVHLDSEGAARLDESWGSPTRLGVPALVFLNADGAVARVQGPLALEAFGGRVLAYDRGRVLAALRAGS